MRGMNIGLENLMLSAMFFTNEFNFFMDRPWVDK